MAEPRPEVLRRSASSELSRSELIGLHHLLDNAFAGDFSEQDWVSSLGGTHVLLHRDDELLAHASVVPRTMLVGDRPIRTGYVEAVATRLDRRRRGLATLVMAEVARVVGERYELGALSTGTPSLYERLGWERWLGPTFASTPAGVVRTADDDGGVLVLLTTAAGMLDRREPITCDWRKGDVW